MGKNSTRGTRGSRFTPMAQRIFYFLCANPQGMTCEQLIAEVYGNGRREPKTADDCIRNAIHEANIWFRNQGLLIQIRQRGMGLYTVYIGPRNGNPVGMWTRRKGTRNERRIR